MYIYNIQIYNIDFHICTFLYPFHSSNISNRNAEAWRVLAAQQRSGEQKEALVVATMARKALVGQVIFPFFLGVLRGVFRVGLLFLVCLWWFVDDSIEMYISTPNTSLETK